MRRSLTVLLLIVATLVSLDAQRSRARRIRPRPTAAVTNPIAAARLPGGVATVPNPYWAQAGAGTIPSGSVCQTLGTNGQTSSFSQSVTAADIETALAACDNGGSQQVVVLETGTYNLASGITFPGNNVTLRGEGPDNTLLVFTNDDSCSGQFAPICMTGSGIGYYVGEGTVPPNVANWTAGYAQGATQVTLSTTANLSVGEIFFLDQLPEASDTGNIWNCVAQFDGVNGCTEQGGAGSTLARGCNSASTCRAQHQAVKVVSCSPSCPNAGSTVVTIDRPLYMMNWRNGQTPGAYWGNDDYREYQGLEDLSIDNLNGTANGHVISMLYVSNSWVKHVRMLYAPSPKTFIVFFGAIRCTVRDTYSYGTFDDSGSSTHYGIEGYGGSDNLVENNIWQRRTSPFVRDGETGSVYAYNYFIDDFYSASPAWMQAGEYSHAAGNNMILDEGNIGVGIKHDSVHGTSHLFTFLRNYSIGWETGKTTETDPVMLHPYQRYMNFVCNVLGRSSYHDSYETTGSATTIWRFRTWFNANGTYSDSVQAGSLMRWGNWDTVSSSNDTSDNDTTGIKWVSGEVPSGESYLPNPVPSSQSCPTSLYLSAKPAFMGSNDRWPGIGPDVTGSQTGTHGNTGVGGHAYKNPAQRCYESLSDDTGYAADSSGTRPKHFTCTYPL